jgi:hypothetical protein
MNQIWSFSPDFHKVPQQQILRKCVRGGGGASLDTCEHTDGETDMTKLTGAFRDNANMPNKAGKQLRNFSNILIPS